MELRSITLQQLLGEASAKYGDKKAVEYGGEYYTWREIDAMSDILADDFARRGVVKGDHVGIWSPNTLMWILTFFAALKLGAVAVLINCNFTAHELKLAVRIGAVKWFCFGQCPRLSEDPGLLDRVRESCPEQIRGGIDIRRLSADLMQFHYEGAEISRSVRDGRGLDCRDVCCMIFTSGTTKAPKCVMLTHHILVNSSANMAELMRITEEDSLCMSLPLFHIFGLCGGFLACVHCGAVVHLMDSIKSSDIMKCVDRYKCTILNGVPTSYLAMINNAAFPGYNMQSIRVGVLGGASVTRQQMRRIQDAFPRTVFMTNYGQTEGACLTNTKYGDSFEHIASTVGLPMDHIRLEIQDPRTKEILGPGEVGEIIVKGYSVMKGYFNPEPGLETIDKDGWLHTEDLGMKDEEGYVRIVGRIKDIIIRGGEDITPLEIEEAILAYDQVSEAKVVGVPHEILGEQVVACLVLKQPNTYREEELRAVLQRKLAPFKHPSHIFLYESFPLGGSGKISTSRLREDAARKVQELACRT